MLSARVQRRQHGRHHVEQHVSMKLAPRRKSVAQQREENRRQEARVQRGHCSYKRKNELARG